jgi:peptidoglycan hydrolase-like protein with peptidoglycan-binding domain
MSNLQIPNPKFCPLLQQGSQGAWVVCLQNALNGIGYGPIVINGYFDFLTSELIKKFQQNVGLMADGRVEENTWSLLNRQPCFPGWEPYWPLIDMTGNNPSYTPVAQTPYTPVAQTLQTAVAPTPQTLVAQLNQAILKAALSLKGMDTSGGPDGGNNACAWSLNRVLQTAGIPALGENPNYVPSLLDALIGGRGKQVSKDEALAGDIVIACGEAHVGVALDDGCNTVLSNSSSRARFVWESDTDFDGYYGGSSTIYRLIK